MTEKKQPRDAGKTVADSQYRASSYTAAEREQAYGKNVHLLDDPYLLTLAAKLSQAQTIQPQINELVVEIYRGMLRTFANLFLARGRQQVPTRMVADTPCGLFDGELILADQRLVIVDLARGGILPATTAFDLFCRLIDPARVRVDHIFVNRAVDGAQKVTGADVAGCKIGGDVQDAILLIPDPMAATGSTMSQALDIYQTQVKGTPRLVVAMAIMATPEFLRRMSRDHPETEIVALRLDRGLSDPEVLASRPGSQWDRECGLNDRQYIVPGAGGLGELMNNSFV